MADITVHVLVAAKGPPTEDLNFLSLAEARAILGMDPADNSQDAAIVMQVAIASTTIMRTCNRYFAKERVIESWRDTDSRRLFLTHWPVKAKDIESVSSGGAATGAWELEERSGKLSNYAGWGLPAVVTYTGGYNLPEEAPLPLKQACILLLRQDKQQATRDAIEGIRQISHKESRVTYFDPNQSSSSSSSSSSSGIDPKITALLKSYIRIEV